MNRVTLVAHDIGPVGGMERQLTELISGLLERGHSITVVSRTCSVPSHPNLEWIRVPGPSRPFPVAYPWFMLVASAVLRLRRRGLIHSTGAIVLNRCDVVTVHLCHAAIRELTDVHRVSRMTIAHRLNARLAGWISRMGERWCYRPERTRFLVAVSAGVRDELRRSFPRMAERTVVVSNGVDTNRFRPLDSASTNGELRAVFVGSEWEGKGLHAAIGALVGLPSWQLLVVGRGDVARYRRIARELGVEGRVTFAGVVEDTAPLYRSANVFVLPSAYETFSLVTYEAAASGLPLLATKVSGIEDLLRDGVNGWFIERDPDGIRMRLDQLQKDGPLQRRLGEAARRMSLRFTWAQMVRDYRAVYAGVEEPDASSSVSD